MSKQSLQKGGETLPPIKEDAKIYLSFTDLFSKKQSWLEQQLLDGKEVYLLSKRIPPIRLTLAELS